MKFLKPLLVSFCLALAISVHAQTANINVNPASKYLLATNLASVAKNSTNTATVNNTVLTNTYLSTLVPLPTSSRGLEILPTFIPAGSLIGTSNIVVGFEVSDGLTYTSTTDPVSISFAQANGTNVTAAIYVSPTNFYGQAYLLPDYVSNQGLTNGTLSLSYSFLDK